MHAVPQTHGSRLQLFFRCEGLKDEDTFSKSDPYLVLYASPNGHIANEMGRTETKKDNLNPKFERMIEVDYLFEQKQEFTLFVFDDDGKGDKGNDRLGNAQFQLSHVVGSRNHTREIALNPGKVFVTAVEVGSGLNKDTVTFGFRGEKMKKMDTFGKSDPYYKFHRQLPNGTRQLLYQTKPIKNTLEPKWPTMPPFKVGQLTGADFSRRDLVFECFDEDTFSDDEMGSFTCSFQELLDAGNPQSNFPGWVLKDKAGEVYGTILLSQFQLTRFPTFLEFLRGGMQINLMVSIDFTGSNGDARNPRSLHYMNPNQPNHYVRAIMSVGDILMEYDTDKQVPAFGFGAQMPDGSVSHCFHLNFQENPHVPGVQGILDNYGRALSSVRLAGPTNFAPSISNALNIAMAAPDVYSILLILTDGEITDMDRTISAIVNCDSAPLSIVIVGVGQCDFEMMDQLDGDNQKLRDASRGIQMKRDIVQFVPFRNFERAPPGALAAEVLKEVPDQVVDWAMATGKRPNGWR